MAKLKLSSKIKKLLLKLKRSTVSNLISIHVCLLFTGQKELNIRNLLSEKLERGKIEFNIHLEQTGDVLNYTLNKTLAKKYHKELKDLAEEIDQDEFTNYLPVLLKMPEVLKAEKEDLDEKQWEIVAKTIEEALTQLGEFRIQEGKYLEKEIADRVHAIMNLLKEVEPFEITRIDQIKARIQKNLEGLQLDANIDQNRFEQELIYYLEKIDVTEEKVRLKQHCDYFLETIVGEGSLGKKLGFISQEIGREINTLGSKSQRSKYPKNCHSNER